jgi:MFS family permease
MTRFAVPVWTFERFGSASSLAFGAALIATSRGLSGPIAGVFVDRSKLKHAILVAEGGQALIIAVLLGLLCFIPDADLLPVYLLMAFAAVFDTLHFPAVVSSLPLLVNERDLVRANGIISFTETFSELAAPFLTAVLLASFGIRGVLAFDVLSFLVAIGAVLLVYIPESVHRAVAPARGSLWLELKDSFAYLHGAVKVRSLLYLSVIGNFFIAGTFVLVSPMVLASSGNNTYLLSMLLACGSAAQVLVSLFTAGFPAQDAESVIYRGYITIGFLGAVLIGLTVNSWVWGVGLIFFMGVIPRVNACSRAIWQATIPHEHQGRFFASKRALSHSTTPVAMALSGLLVDLVFLPMFGIQNVLGYRFAFIVFGVVIGMLGIQSLLKYRRRSLAQVGIMLAENVS